MSGCEERDLLQLLQRFWGYKTFRPLQQQAIQGVLAGRDVVLILPTGGGKSLTFQIPPLTKEYAVTGVVCPLIALAKVNLSHQKNLKLDFSEFHAFHTTHYTQRGLKLQGVL